MSGKENKAAPDIASVPELMAHAYAIEAEAEERYLDLAGQMETHNNPEVAALFRKLAEYEGLHAQHILAEAPDITLPEIAPWDFKWLSAESPELVDLLEIHYLMTPQQALMLALAAEEAAFRFFDRLARNANDADIKKMAADFAEEEREHIQMVQAMLDKHRPPRPDWDEDLDPAISQG
jgi:rubrerythrin